MPNPPAPATKLTSSRVVSVHTLTREREEACSALTSSKVSPTRLTNLALTWNIYILTFFYLNLSRRPASGVRLWQGIRKRTAAEPLSSILKIMVVPCFWTSSPEGNSGPFSSREVLFSLSTQTRFASSGQRETSLQDGMFSTSESTLAAEWKFWSRTRWPQTVVASMARRVFWRRAQGV